MSRRVLKLVKAANVPSALCLSRRTVFQEHHRWDEWSENSRTQLEQYWFPRLTEVDRLANERTDSSQLEKCYVLSMFPYPSGRLHMGHLRVYTVTDVLARWQRLRGKHVVQPMGWDAFGLPAENAAIERGKSPSEWTKDNIAAMKSQLMSMGLSLDWSRELSTCDPAYYRWTQWLFLKLHEHGLTYQRRALVNWDPVDRTVLADELVDEEGRSWRSGAVVEKRKLRQWFFRTTAYSKSLLDGLRTVEGNQWRDVIKRQRGWIGRLSGTSVEFDVKDLRTGQLLPDRLHVYTDAPHRLFHVAFILVNGENMLAEPDLLPRDHDCVRLPLHALHPLTGHPLPVILSRRLVFREEESLDARLGFPHESEEDAATAAAFSCPVPYDPGQLDGLGEEEARRRAMELLQDANRGGFPVSPLRTDWLISRQRFWGTPIPIIHCPSCGVVPVPDDDLPVTLPGVEEVGGRMAAPLANFDDWRRTSCPNCGGEAERETDTMDTFVDSSWYFLRFLDPDNSSAIFNKETVNRLMPVDIYVGGIEHAIRHLFYARFVSHFLFDLGLLPQREPFVQFLPVGLVMGRTFQVARTGKFLHARDVRVEDDRLVAAGSDEAVTETWDKMSKSKHNGTDPEEVISRLGVETTRLCMLSNTGPHKGRRWEEDAVLQGVVNWQRRVWALVGDMVDAGQGRPLPPFPDSASHPDPLSADEKFLRQRARCLSKVGRCFEENFVISAAVANLQTLTDRLRKVPVETRVLSPLYADSLCDLVVCISPLAPMFASELWSGLQWALSDRGSARYDLNLPVQMQHFVLPPDSRSTYPEGRSVTGDADSA